MLHKLNLLQGAQNKSIKLDEIFNFFVFALYIQQHESRRQK